MSQLGTIIEINQLYFVSQSNIGYLIRLSIAFVEQCCATFFVIFVIYGCTQMPWQIPWMQMSAKHFIVVAFAILCSQGTYAPGLTLLRVCTRSKPVLCCLQYPKIMHASHDTWAKNQNARLRILHVCTSPTASFATATGSHVCKCGTFKNTGKPSCCASGGDWFGNCGPKMDHTWLEGVQACESSKFGKQQLCISSKHGDFSVVCIFITCMWMSATTKKSSPTVTSTASPATGSRIYIQCLNLNPYSFFVALPGCLYCLTSA